MRGGIFLGGALAVAGLSLAGCTAALAADAVVRAEGESRSVACDGGAASVGGNRNTLTFTGVCKGIEIRGEANAVVVVLAPGAPIDIEGNHNKVRYSAAAGVPPRLRVAGSFNEVAPDARSPAPAADTARLEGDNEVVELDCGGRSVTLQGVRSTYRLRGACAALTVRGEANTVVVDLAPAAQVLVEGNGIVLSYTVRDGGADPAATVRGMGSSVDRRGGGVARVAAVGGDVVPQSVPLLMNDLDAVVVEAGTRVRLPPAVFTNDGLSPAGETQLARLVALMAQIHPAGVRLASNDPADPAAAQARMARVQGWMATHGVRLPVEGVVAVGPVAVEVLLLR